MQWNSKYNHEEEERGLDNEAQLQGFKSSPNPWRKLMIPPGFQFLTQMTVTVSANSGVLSIVNDGVLNYLEVLWQATVMRKSKWTQISISAILLIQSDLQRGALGPTDSSQVSPYRRHSTPIPWTMLHHHVTGFWMTPESAKYPFWDRITVTI